MISIMSPGSGDLGLVDLEQHLYDGAGFIWPRTQRNVIYRSGVCRFDFELKESPPPLLNFPFKQDMEAGRMELDPCGQELRGSTITGEISSVNHRTPSSAQYVEGRVGLSNDQKRANKREADARSRQKKKQMEERMMNDLERQEKCSGELERENNRLKWKRDQLEVDVQEENRKILNQLLGILVEQNTEINIIGEGSMSHDGLNNQREMNQASITNADTIFRENASMNLQTLPRSAPPAGSSGSTDDHKQARKRIADKKCRDKKKREINGVLERIKELETKNIKLELDNAVLNAVAIQSQKTLTLLRHISALMTFENARKNSLLEEVLNDYMNLHLQNHGQGNTPFNMQVRLFTIVLSFYYFETLRDMNMHGDNKQLDDEERESKETERLFVGVVLYLVFLEDFGRYYHGFSCLFYLLYFDCESTLILSYA
ncbi:hypothetical protein SADUNF_Sadunf14G0030600 [Salix dunnii]|uniref:BZIP domain-containing protein n=1 Tax=Salix dunnii TaxID=1413687 RepID=A0A835JEH1_9ROSI|nr:hypothetical protein SADUNF_Sadunf14G0030600 [Salix dunnii]